MDWRGVRRSLRNALALRRVRRVTCLDCGFLANGKGEVTRADRVILNTRGRAGMLADWEALNCSRSLWVSYDLTYAGPSLEGIFDEVEESRRTCDGFHRHVPGLSPAEHLARALQASENGLVRWLIEKLLSIVK